MDFTIRTAFLIITLPAQQSFSQQRRSISFQALYSAKPALDTFLKHILRKHQFQDKQAEAIFNVLCQKNSIVSLPNGAGKSLIYQLAGLLMPGVTVVVDPIIAPIDDQVEALQRYGIDPYADRCRRKAQESHDVALQELNRILESIERLEPANRICCRKANGRHIHSG